MRLSRIMMIAALACGGCTFDRPDTSPKPTSGYEVVHMPADSQQLAQANMAACTRVYQIGQNILAKNTELQQRMVFRAAASPDPEIFHQGASSIVITQKVIDMCATDAQLAAVLCMELGKMTAEREALAPLEADQSPQTPHPPLEGPAFNSTVGAANEDPMRLYELAQYEAHQKKINTPPRLLDPQELARKYLTRAGFAPEELERVKPILRAAADHADLETQFHGSPRGAPFTPPR
jgi:hypothetical protein